MYTSKRIIDIAVEQFDPLNCIQCQIQNVLGYECRDTNAFESTLTFLSHKSHTITLWAKPCFVNNIQIQQLKSKSNQAFVDL